MRHARDNRRAWPRGWVAPPLRGHRLLGSRPTTPAASTSAVLHVEVGGSYGGSLRALELYLAHTQRRGLDHDVLFYHPTPGAERLVGLARSVLIAFDSAPMSGARVQHAGTSWATRTRHTAGRLAPPGLREWAALRHGALGLGRLTRLIRDGGYGLVHVNNTFTYQPLTVAAARLAGRPVLLHVRNPVRHGTFARALMGLSAGVVTVNDQLRRELTSWGGNTPVSTCYDPTEVDPPRREVTASLRAQFVRDGAVLVGSAGRLDEQKGYEHLVRAASAVVRSHPEVRFAVAGEGPTREALTRLVCELSLQGKFHLCGFLGDVSSFLAALDVYVSSSLWEGGGPLAVVEAMLLGKRVVTTNVGAAPEFVEPEQTAVVVPPGDSAALARALVRTIEAGPEFLDAERVRRGAASFADPHRNAQAFDLVLERLLGAVS